MISVVYCLLILLIFIKGIKDVIVLRIGEK